jgi:hypothetical protein
MVPEPEANDASEMSDVAAQRDHVHHPIKQGPKHELRIGGSIRARGRDTFNDSFANNSVS